MKIRRQKQEKGDSLLVVLIVSGIVLGLVVGLASFYLRSQRRMENLGALTAADLAVGELLEYFRGISPLALVNYLATNPVTGGTAVGQVYPFCSHINILDRSTGKLVNQDNLAAMPISILDWPANIRSRPANFSIRPNRFYQVFVVDMRTLAIDPAYCNITARDVLTAAPLPNKHPAINIPSTHKFLVAVGVTWLSKEGDTLAKLQAANQDKVRYGYFSRTSATTILPGPY